MAHVTMEDLKKRFGITDEQLGQVISDDDLEKIAMNMTDYLSYAVALKLKEGERQAIKIASDPAKWWIKSYNVLLAWKNANEIIATYGALAKVALAQGEGAFAGKIVQVCKSKRK